MNLMSTLNGILAQLRPFIQFVALLFGVLAAYLALVELVPVLAQIWRPKGDVQRYAIVGAALAIIAGRG